MGYPSIKLVAAPEVGAAVRFDFNASAVAAPPGRWVLRDSISLGVPEALGDVDAVAPSYGLRTVAFTMRVTGTREAALAALSQAGRALLAGRGWLLWQLTATSQPVWFRTYRAQPGDLSLEHVSADGDGTADIWDTQVRLECEPFVYGKRVTLSSQNFNSDPTAFLQTLFTVTLPAIAGDAPARLLVKNNNISSRRLLVCVSADRAETGSGVTGEEWLPSLIPVGTSDGLTTDTDSSGTVSASTWVDGSARVTTFSTFAGMRARVTANELPARVLLRRGQYRVLARFGASSATATTFKARFVTGTSTDLAAPADRTWSPHPNDVTVTTDNNEFGYWTDLGVHALPPNNPADGLPLTAQATAVRWAIVASRISGTANLITDSIIMIPVKASDLLGATTSVIESALGVGFAIDAQTESAATISNTGLATFRQVVLKGRYPEVVPGARNTITYVSPIGAAGTLLQASELELSYLPRWLYIGDS